MKNKLQIELFSTFPPLILSSNIATNYLRIPTPHKEKKLLVYVGHASTSLIFYQIWTSYHGGLQMNFSQLGGDK